MEKANRVGVLVKEALPEFASELERLLAAEGHTDLARQVPELGIVDRCRCGDDFCSTFYTQPKPQGSYGPGHESIELEPERGMIILDLVNGVIMCVEVLNRDDVRGELYAAVP